MVQKYFRSLIRIQLKILQYRYNGTAIFLLIVLCGLLSIDAHALLGNYNSVVNHLSKGSADAYNTLAPYVDDLRNNNKDDWPIAIHRLIDNDALELSYQDVIAKIPLLNNENRKIIAKNLWRHRNLLGGLIVAALLAVDPDEKIAKIARDNLYHFNHPDTLLNIIDALKIDYPGRPFLIQYFAKQYQKHIRVLNKVNENRDSSQFIWALAQNSSSAYRGIGARYANPILPLLHNESVNVRVASVNFLREISDDRINTALLTLINDPDRNVRTHVLWTLAQRGNKQAYSQLLSLHPKDKDPNERVKFYARLGDVYWWNLPHLFEQYLASANSPDQHLYKTMVTEARHYTIFSLPDMYSIISNYSEHTDSFVSESATELLSWQNNPPSIQLVYNSERPWVVIIVLSFGLLICGFVGLLIFIWAYRLIRLKYLVEFMPIISIRALAMGLSTVKGRVVASSLGLVTYPSTGEACLYYPGMEKEHPKHNFYLKDASGKILVAPKSAVFLSANRLLLPNDEVRMIGTVKVHKNKISNSSTDKNLHRVICKNNVPRSSFSSITHFIINRIFGAHASSGQTRMLFSDPQYCFWIWDTSRHKPLDSAQDYNILIGLMLLTGAWIMLFTVMGISLVDIKFSESLLDIFGTSNR